jgi:hypothetical protein
MNGRHRSTSLRAAGGGASPVGDLVELAAVELVLEHGAEIGRDAQHAPRPDRLDAGLLDRLEHRARLLAARHQAAVHRRIVAGKLERDRVGVAAHDCGLLAREAARRLGQPHLAAHQPGTFGRERHVELGLARDRLQAAGDRALERLGWGFLRRAFGLDVGGHRSVQPQIFPSSFRDGAKGRTRNPDADSHLV